MKLTASKAAIKRIRSEMTHPYDGIMYEGTNRPRKGLWVRFRIEDVPFIAAALADGDRSLSGEEKPTISKTGG